MIPGSEVRLHVTAKVRNICAQVSTVSARVDHRYLSSCMKHTLPIITAAAPSHRLNAVQRYV